MIYKKGNYLLVITPLIFILVLFYLPLLKILSKGVNIDFFKEILNSFYYHKIISFTFYQSFLSSLLSVLIAIPGAYMLSRYDFPGKRIFLSLASLPFILPSILTVLGFVLLFGNNGIINRFLMNIMKLEKPPLLILYSLKAVLLAHVFYNFPLAIRIISNKWKKIPYELMEASYSLGYGKIKTFFSVTLKYLSSSIFTSFTLIFLYCFMSFGIILVLGGGPSLSTIEVEVYRFARISLNIEKAATLSLIESFFTILVLLIYLKCEKKDYFRITGKNKLRKITKFKSMLFSIYLIPLSTVILAPILVIVLNSFIKKRGYTDIFNITLYWYRSIFSTIGNNFNTMAINSIRNSILLGVMTILITVPLALVITYNINRNIKFKNYYTLIFFLPMGISSVIIGLSYLNMNYRSSYIMIVFAHTFISLPLAVRSINNIYNTMDVSLIEASLSLGYNRLLTFFKIEIPVIKSGLITASVFSFSLSMGEMNASIMLAPNGFVTIPLAIYQLIGSYNFYGACALGSILLIVSLGTFIIMDKME